MGISAHGGTLTAEPCVSEPILTAPDALRATPLDTWHRALGARMVPFAGYAMPVQYAPPPEIAARCRGGVLAEHLHCRAAAALFDVSHMGQAWLAGPGAAAALERLVVGDIAGLPPGHQRYTLLTDPAGGILDDLMVANLGEGRLFLVVNASRKDADFAHIAAALPADVRLQPLADRALLALQGPQAAAVLSRLCPPAAALPFLGVAALPVAGIDALISRSGYTGEDGFELSVPAAARRGAGRGAAGAAGGGARGPGRARFVAAGGRALPLRQRHRHDDHAGGSRAGLDHRQTPPAGLGLPRRRRDPRPAGSRRRRAGGWGCGSMGAPRPAPARRSWAPGGTWPAR